MNKIFDKAITLAPMESITDISYRILCKEMGADIVYTEFINSDGLTRGCKRGKKKISFFPEERPIGVQIYGSRIDAMTEAVDIILPHNPDFLDINAGCWVKKVSSRGAGAGLLKDPCYMQEMVSAIVKKSTIPVTVKTRIGWDEQSINIIEVAKRLEDVGISALTIHCRPRSQGHSGEAAWHWIDKVKEVVNIPIILNGGIFTAEQVRSAFQQTKTDGVMIARGAIGYPWIFKQAKELMTTGEIKTFPTLRNRIEVCLRHLRLSIEEKGTKVAVPAFRKYYSGYFKGMKNISKLRVSLMSEHSYEPIEEKLFNFLEKEEVIEG